MASRSRQASMVRAFFMATSNTCVRLSIIAPPPCALDLRFDGKNGKFCTPQRSDIMAMPKT
jgi:hypothetical protein